MFLTFCTGCAPQFMVRKLGIISKCAVVKELAMEHIRRHNWRNWTSRYTPG